MTFLGSSHCDICRFIEACSFITKECTIIITSLDTLIALFLERNGLRENCPSHFWNIADYIGTYTRRLNVALRLPVAFYVSLEETDPSIAVTTEDTSTTPAAGVMWSRLWLAISQLRYLRHLCIWLDHHDETQSWSVVKERIALSHCIAAFKNQEETLSGENSTPRINFSLPKLHRGIATAETHFVQERPPLPFSIRRRDRYRYFSEESPDGTPILAYELDIPLCELCLMEQEQASNPPGELSMGTEQVEEMEENLWEFEYYDGSDYGILD